MMRSLSLCFSLFLARGETTPTKVDGSKTNPAQKASAEKKAETSPSPTTTSPESTNTDEKLKTKPPPPTETASTTVASSPTTGNPNAKSPPSRVKILPKSPTPCKDEKAYLESQYREWAWRHISSKTPIPNNAPHLLLLMGGSGSGKTTLIRRIREADPTFNHHYFLHGLDEYLGYIPEYQKSVGDRTIVYEDAADSCYGQAKKIAQAAQELAILKKLSLIYEDTGKNLKRVFEKILPPFHEAGYVVHIAFVDVPVTVALERVESRFRREGRFSSPDYVKGTHNNLLDHYLQITAHKKNHPISLYCDNSCSKYRRGAERCMHCWETYTQHSEASNFRGANVGDPFLGLHGLLGVDWIDRTEDADYIGERREGVRNVNENFPPMN